MICYELKTNPAVVSLSEIPDLDYNRFYDQTVTLLKKHSNHCVNYFVVKKGPRLRFIILVADDERHLAYIYSHYQNYNDLRILKSISAECLQMHVFEREIHETYGIDFTGHPWLKPLRYPQARYRTDLQIRNYPFYSIDSEEVHEVGVGPVHAGVIEPGHFRFICHGENVLHLEIQLGYQHREAGRLLTEETGILKRSLIAESVAGDTAVGHSIAFTQCIEALAGFNPGNTLRKERVIAVEMERLAVHIGDMAALCGDVGYQPGQVACEALRTIVINTTQDWCGNRFGKGLVKPGGTNYPLTGATVTLMNQRLEEVKERLFRVTELIFNNTGIISRFENTGPVTVTQARHAGAVGMAARASGLNRDVRSSHPFQYYTNLNFKPVILENGDVLSRALLRKHESELSFNLISDLLTGLKYADGVPDYKMRCAAESLSVSMSEGWRGEICHAAVTDADGKIIHYSVKDPSLHNWMMLALAVRGQEISDFPLCNKSFNLSYCGHDL